MSGIPGVSIQPEPDGISNGSATDRVDVNVPGRAISVTSPTARSAGHKTITSRLADPGMPEHGDLAGPQVRHREQITDACGGYGQFQVGELLAERFRQRSVLVRQTPGQPAMVASSARLRPVWWRVRQSATTISSWSALATTTRLVGSVSSAVRRNIAGTWCFSPHDAVRCWAARSNARPRPRRRADHDRAAGPRGAHRRDTRRVGRPPSTHPPAPGRRADFTSGVLGVGVLGTGLGLRAANSCRSAP